MNNSSYNSSTQTQYVIRSGNGTGVTSKMAFLVYGDFILWIIFWLVSRVIDIQSRLLWWVWKQVVKCVDHYLQMRQRIRQWLGEYDLALEYAELGILLITTKLIITAITRWMPY